jgi:hypothetical protein
MAHFPLMQGLSARGIRFTPVMSLGHSPTAAVGLLARKRIFRFSSRGSGSLLLVTIMEDRLWRSLAPLLFQEHDPEAAQAARISVVAPAQRSKATRKKVASRKTSDGYLVQSFQNLPK